MVRFLKFLAGLMVGLLLGSALIALIAPRPGTWTRKCVSQRVHEILEEARRAAEDTRSEAHIRLAELKTRQIDA